MQELKLPKRGQAMEEGTVVEWTVEEGDRVAAGEVVVLFETDKTTDELEADQDGILLAKVVTEGETVPIGTTLGYIGTEAEADEVPEGDGVDADASAGDGDEPTPAIRSTTDGQAATNGEESPGTRVRASPSARRAARERDVEVETVGETLGVTTVRQEHVAEFVEEHGDGRAEAIRGSPAARRIANENGVTVSEVGEALGETRVRMADVETYLEMEETREEAAETGVEPEPGREREPEPSSADAGPAVHDSIPVTGARKTMHDRMQRVASEYGSTTTVAKVDVTELLELRESLSEAWQERHDVSPSLTAFVVRAVAEALPEYRILNAEIVSEDGQATEVRRFEDVNVGIAVDTDHGLLVPTIYDADERTVRGLSGEIQRLAEAARNRELDFGDQQNGTFTVSNAGTFGAYVNTPQINPPQAAILGTCAVVEEPGVVDGEVRPRKFMHLCLTYDHRVVEGATAVQFLQAVKDRMEEPASLLA